MRRFRPDHADWKPSANAGADRIEAYKRAADKLGIAIQVAYPIPGDNAEMCAGHGLNGIYIARSQSEREQELTNEMWAQERAMKS